LDSVNAEGAVANIFFFYDGRQNGPGWISLKHAGFAPGKMGPGSIYSQGFVLLSTLERNHAHQGQTLSSLCQLDYILSVEHLFTIKSDPNGFLNTHPDPIIEDASLEVYFCLL